MESVLGSESRFYFLFVTTPSLLSKGLISRIATR